MISRPDASSPFLVQGLSAGGQPSVPAQSAKEIGVEFEAILLRQLLRMARSATDSSAGQAVSAEYLRIADDHMADFLARSGGVGMAEAFVKQMTAQKKAAELIGQP
jgi:Rod binding domain-containing protein